MMRALILSAALLPMLLVSAHARPRAFDRADRVIRHHDDSARRPMRMHREVRSFNHEARVNRVRTPRMPAKVAQVIRRRGDMATRTHERMAQRAERHAVRTQRAKSARAPGRLGAILEKRKDMVVGAKDHPAKKRSSDGEAKSVLEERNKYMRKNLFGKALSMPPNMPGKLRVAIMKHQHIMQQEPGR